MAEGPVFTLDLFRSSDWKDDLSSADALYCGGRWQVFTLAANRAREASNIRSAEMCEMLAAICQMHLDPAHIVEPLGPMSVSEGRRSLIPADLDKEQLTFLSTIVREVNDPWIQARFADVLWIRKVPGCHEFGLLAVDAYTKIPLDGEAWHRGGRDCWLRAIKLALQLGNATRSRLTAIADALQSALSKATSVDVYHALSLSKVLKEIARQQDAMHVIKHLADIASEFETTGNLDAAIDYYVEAASWSRGDLRSDYTLHQAQCDSVFAIYAWWLGLRLVFLPFWNNLATSDRSV